MKNEQLKIIVESLLDITEKAGKRTIELHDSGLKIIKKPDNSPVTNGDLEVDKMLKAKLKNDT
jgi:3''-Phosphoadenosine 5''-phosphosulfate (PAPS) 3''-phosphatase